MALHELPSDILRRVVLLLCDRDMAQLSMSCRRARKLVAEVHGVATLLYPAPQRTSSARASVVRVICAFDRYLPLTGATLGAEGVGDHKERSRIPGHCGRDNRIFEGMVWWSFIQSHL